MTDKPTTRIRAAIRGPIASTVALLLTVCGALALAYSWGYRRAIAEQATISVGAVPPDLATVQSIGLGLVFAGLALAGIQAVERRKITADRAQASATAMIVVVYGSIAAALVVAFGVEGAIVAVIGIAAMLGHSRWRMQRLDSETDRQNT